MKTKNIKILKTILTGCVVSIFPYTASAISFERVPDGAVRAFSQYDKDPDITKSGYASVDTRGCSGTMIGPNTMMTAAHCSGANRNITFRVYTADDAEPLTENFGPCIYTTHTYMDSDLILYDCPANAKGENPGDKYGYLDFDIKKPGERIDYRNRETLNIGNELYSFWTNPIDNLGTRNHSLYSKGNIVSNTASLWSNPTRDLIACGDQTNDWSIGIETSLWGRGGASGSSHISAKNHRIVLGPLSTTRATDAQYRNSLSIRDYLYYGKAEQQVGTPDCAPTVKSDAVNKPYLTGLGLSNPSQYYGRIDKQRDGLFDVQQDIEKLRGESQRDWTWLGFESQRRNELWSKSSSTRFYNSTPTGFAIIGLPSIPTASYSSALWHTNLDLEPYKYYQISFTVYTSRTENTHPMQVCLDNAILYSGAPNCEEIELPGAQWAHKVVTLKATSNTLRFRQAANSEFLLANVSIVKQNSIMDFDSHDSRYSWKNPHDQTRGLIVPDGKPDLSPSGSRTIDFAGVVFHNPNTSENAENWTLSNSEMAIDSTTFLDRRVCFSQRNSNKWNLEWGAKGMLRVVNESGVIPGSTIEFAPARNYTEICSNWFTMPTDYNRVEFGAKGRQLYRKGAYYIDDIRIEKRSRFIGIDKPKVPVNPFQINIEKTSP